MTAQLKTILEAMGASVVDFQVVDFWGVVTVQAVSASETDDRLPFFKYCVKCGVDITEAGG